MSKKPSTKKATKKAVSAVVVEATTADAGLSYDEMLNELEAIVVEADVRLAEEEASL
ncbi:hypothetical protein M979_4045 [Buttiauxella noackiae ATCC 51607]|uniref:Uncharacterized protein n=1 Tax=Buttiauxella noackiae ATCC 51607 TaxID=1354255 RepID=A0A1B7HHN5_9ENTR|nr:hypothetical protein [Buttiauxella noackiae]OAT15097.1 hypothetical protein M979_4045 [Buttiauxella noackiae ATCC 51607]